MRRDGNDLARPIRKNVTRPRNWYRPEWIVTRRQKLEKVRLRGCSQTTQPLRIPRDRRPFTSPRRAWARRTRCHCRYWYRHIGAALGQDLELLAGRQRQLR